MATAVLIGDGLSSTTRLRASGGLLPVEPLRYYLSSALAAPGLTISADPSSALLMMYDLDIARIADHSYHSQNTKAGMNALLSNT